MKKFIRFFMTLFAIALFFTAAPAAKAYGTVNAMVEVEFDQTGARAMLDILNNFRLYGDDSTGRPWYWSENNYTRVYPNVQPLAYDYTLEQIAMQRAVEAAISYSHTRPDGSRYSTVPGFTAYYNRGENICVGYYYLDNAQAAMNMWAEYYEYFAGQGHRRNMLTNYTSVGVAHVIYNGCHYWVQEFGTPTLNANPTPAVDGSKLMSVNIANGTYNLTSSASSVTAQVGIPCELPELTATVTTPTAYPGYPCPLAGAVWTVANTNLATVSGNTLIPKAEGKTQLVASCYGKTVSIPLTITKAAEIKVEIQMSSVCLAYNGSRQTPEIVITDETGKTLKENIDYSANYSSSCTEIGTHNVTLTGKNAYTFMTEVQFEIASTMKLPAFMSTIEADGFSGLNAQMIIVPANATVLESRAFADCSQLKVITFEGNPTSIDNSILQGCGNVTVRALKGGSAESWAVSMGYPVEYI